MTCICTHAESGHCKGGQRHAYHKDEARMMRQPQVHVCASRHCLEPLCDCVDYRERVRKPRNKVKRFTESEIPSMEAW
jgi:hypothetical protein